MGEVVSVGSGALEELRERLLRWDELCAQLRELYYRYLDLAAFRSEKCYFPGRKCKRSWKRQYDIGDLTLMWAYILSTAPLCGRLVKALAEVEYKVRLKALENFEKYGGTARTSEPEKSRRLTSFYLNKPVRTYVVFWNNRLYILRDEVAGSLNGKGPYGKRLELELMSLVSRFELGEVNVGITVIDIDNAVSNLLFEVPLPETVSKQLNGKMTAPIALFKNLGWLLTDDSRRELRHTTNNLGQATARLIDWIALAKYAKDVLKIVENRPLVFKLVSHSVSFTKKGLSVGIEIQPIGTVAKVIKKVYNYFGITLGEPTAVFQHVIDILKSLKDEAFRREKNVYVVNDVGAWIAYSNVITTAILGDGTMTPTDLLIYFKGDGKGDTNLTKKYAEAAGGYAKSDRVLLRPWVLRLLLPIPIIPAFRKSIKLYHILVNYLSAASVKVNGKTYLLYRHERNFVIEGNSALELYEVFKSKCPWIKLKGDKLKLTLNQLKRLKKCGAKVRLMSEIERDRVRELPSHSFNIDVQKVRQILSKVVKIGRIAMYRIEGKDYLIIKLPDIDTAKIIRDELKNAGIRASLLQRKKEVRIREENSVRVVKEIIQEFFSKLHVHNSCFLSISLHFLCQSGADAVEGGKPIHLYGGHPALDRVEPAAKTHLDLRRRTLQSFQNFDMRPEQCCQNGYIELYS